MQSPFPIHERLADWRIHRCQQSPRQDFLCAPAPGTAKAYTFNIDSFAKFDVCTTQSMDDLAATNKSNSLLPSFTHGTALAWATQGAMLDVIAKFMNSRMNSKDAVAQLAKASKVK